MKSCILIKGKEVGQCRILVHDLVLDGTYRSYFYENRGYRPCLFMEVSCSELRGDVENVKGFFLHEFTSTEIRRALDDIGGKTRLRGYTEDPRYKEELEEALIILSLEEEKYDDIKIYYGVKN